MTAASHLRTVAATAANAASSRSHLIIRLNAVVARGAGELVISELNLVDLAGSERMNRAQTAGDTSRVREGNTINRDLLCLGNVITALVARSKAVAGCAQHEGGSVHVPYRACKLTRILQTALGGAARTVLVACVSKLPEWHLEQTKSTLEFAARAAQVVCVPKIAARLTTLRKPGLANAQLEEVAVEVQRLRHVLDEQLAAEAKLLEVRFPVFSRIALCAFEHKQESKGVKQRALFFSIYPSCARHVLARHSMSQAL